MAVKTDAKLQLNIDYPALCKKLQSMLEEEQEKVSALEIQAETRKVEASERESRMHSELKRLKQRHEEQLKKLIDSGADPAAIDALMKENEAEMEFVQEQQVRHCFFQTKIFQNNPTKTTTHQQAEERLNEEERYDDEMKELVVESEVVSSKEITKIKDEHDAEVCLKAFCFFLERWQYWGSH